MINDVTTTWSEASGPGLFVLSGKQVATVISGKQLGISGQSVVRIGAAGIRNNEARLCERIRVLKKKWAGVPKAFTHLCEFPIVLRAWGTDWTPEQLDEGKDLLVSALDDQLKRATAYPNETVYVVNPDIDLGSVMTGVGIKLQAIDNPRQSAPSPTSINQERKRRQQKASAPPPHTLATMLPVDFGMFAVFSFIVGRVETLYPSRMLIYVALVAVVCAVAALFSLRLFKGFKKYTRWEAQITLAILVTLGCGGGVVAELLTPSAGATSAIVKTITALPPAQLSLSPRFRQEQAAQPQDPSYQLPVTAGPMVVANASMCPAGYSVIESSMFSHNGTGISMPADARVCLVKDTLDHNATGLELRPAGN